MDAADDETVRVTILIAEDDDGHAELIEVHLRDAGMAYPLLRFRDGRELLEFLGGHDPQFCRTPGGGRQSFCALLDIRMPRMDGIETLRRIKESPSWHSLPVFMLTTTDDPREVDVCYGIGCNGYISKPIEYKQFADTVQRLGVLLKSIRFPVILADPF